MLSQRILVVDDDPRIQSVMRRGLAFAGYQVELASDGEEALAVVRDSPPDLVILDIMLPGLDGMQVCRRLRAGDTELPILMLTARDQVPDRVSGLDAGADDYLVKPFAFEELLARLRALLRRAQPDNDPVLRYANLSLNTTTREVERSGHRIDLTVKEYEILELLLNNPRQVLSRETIMERVWGSDYLGGSNLIDVHVKHLRDKLEASGESRLIRTIRGIGYSLRES